MKNNSNKNNLSSKEIVQFLRDFFAKASVNIRAIEASLEGENERYNIVTPDSAILIGHSGEALHAVETLVRELLHKQGLGDKKILLDINNYKKMREHRLFEEVRRAANDVRENKTEHEFPPMNAYERLLVHNAAAEEAHVESSSVGEGRERRVKLHYIE